VTALLQPRRATPLLSLALACALLAAAAPAAAQGLRPGSDTQRPAMIKGFVRDAEDGQPLAYTNVYIASSSIGTIALQDGQFYLTGLRPGTYTVRASYISYALGSETVTVAPGEVAVIEFRLAVEAIYTDAIEVSAERRLIEIERTGSSHLLTSAQMDALPLDNLVEMIAQKPGVTLQDNEIHIRGGRADDTQFIIDGVSVNDPLAGGGYGYAIDPSIINEIEVLTGGFNAEYGQAVSGVVNVSTKEGSERWSGKASWKRDHWGGADAAVEPDWRQPYELDRSQNIDVVKASVSGPDPLSGALGALGLDVPGKTYLLLSGSMDVRDGPLPIYSRTRRLTSPLYDFDWVAPRQQNEWNGMAKWTWAVNPRHKLNFTVNRQFEISQGFELAGEGYPRPFQDNLDRYLVFTNESILSQLYYRWVMSDKDYFEVNFGRNFSRQHANINGNDDFTTYPLINSPPSPTGLAFGSADRWHDHYAESWNFKTTYAWVANETNQFKTGLELNFTEMQLVDLQSSLGSPPPGKLGIKEDIFKVHPIVGAAFFQDTINYKGMIVNAGARLDAWAPGREVEYVMDHSDDYLFIYDDMAEEFYDNTVEFCLRSWKMRVSPRLGVSFPVTDKDKFFFNYGHFSQWPRYAYVYPQLQSQTATKIQLLGNPNLDPKITVEYETGVQHEFPGLWSLGVTFFNRDIYGYAKSVQMKPVNIGADETPDPNDTGTVTIEPVRYFNGDSARSLGVELSVIKRTTRWLSGSGSLELSRSTGTNSDADEAYLLAVYDEAYTPTASIGGLKRNPLLWDKPWKVSFNLDFTVERKDRPRVFGWTVPADWSLNLLFQAEAGQRYTPRAFADPENPVLGEYVYGDPYSGLGPTKHSLNLRFNKSWDLSRRQRLTFFFEGRNVLNHKNYRRINPWTGTGYQVGDLNPGWVDNYADWYGEEGPVLNTYSREYVKSQIDPSYIEDPRMLLLGVSFSW
jgi:outer membrane receptor protein involved in Fe transport